MASNICLEVLDFIIRVLVRLLKYFLAVACVRLTKALLDT